VVPAAAADLSEASPSGAPSGNSHPSGGLGGAYAGYNFQAGRFVTGLEGDIEGANLSGSYST
jgi:outer membrane immunogenic protein